MVTPRDKGQDETITQQGKIQRYLAWEPLQNLTPDDLSFLIGQFADTHLELVQSAVLNYVCIDDFLFLLYSLLNVGKEYVIKVLERKLALFD